MAAGTARDVVKELRERFWIQTASDAGTGPRSWAAIQVTLQWPLERVAVGRDRNDPGDGFRYVFRTGTGGIESRAEWFEVTEVFEGVRPMDVESFMRVQIGGRAGPGFDPVSFLTGLDLGIPGRAAQRRAADKVLAAIERKLAKPSYAGMPRDHGYGTLIVGLPLWFATDPLDPLRPENVIDDFTTRVHIGLRAHARRLRKKNCPFWRIVVVWKGSLQSARQWRARAKLDVYEDPAHRELGSLPVRIGSVETLLLDALEKAASEMEQAGEPFDGFTRVLWAVRPDKRETNPPLRLPPMVEALSRHLEDFAESHGPSRRNRLKTRVVVKLIEVLCFLRARGIRGFERWAVARLSPSRRIARFALRRRALQLYRASLARATSGGRAAQPRLTIGSRRASAYPEKLLDSKSQGRWAGGRPAGRGSDCHGGLRDRDRA